MKISISWLKQLVDYKLSPQELAEQLSLKSIGVKEITPDYIELDLTYNRGDLLSLRGVAREIAAITGSTLKFQDSSQLDTKLPKTTVKIEDETLSEVQCSAKIEGLKVEPSPEEWIKKLSDCGMRSVNNIVDVTNFIMLEFGQPLHGFDAEALKDETIIVRNAREGEQLATLDGKLRKLSTQDIVLADTEKPLDVAGIMGSKDTEVTDSTTEILLSASMFNPVMVRRTANRLGLHSEASKRFQHGLTKTNLRQALSAAIKMYEELGGKLTAITLTGDLDDKPKTITLNQEKVNSLIGINVPPEQVEKSLQSLGFHLKRTGVNVNHLEGGLAWHVSFPYWRLDINIEEDLIEEVARMYGYEKIPPQALRGKLPEKLDQTLQQFIYDLKVALKDAGLTEVQTYSFYSSKVINNLQLPVNKLVKIANPISSETRYLRNNLWPNLIEVVGKNLKQGFKDIAIFEIGKVYSPARNASTSVAGGPKKGELPNENYHLAIALMNGSDNPVTELFSFANSLKIAGASGILGNSTLFHPTRITNNMAEVHPRVLNKFGIDKRVAILAIAIDELISPS